MKATDAERELWLAATLLAALAIASMLAVPAYGQSPNVGSRGSASCIPHQLPEPPGTTGKAPSRAAAPPNNLSDRLAQADGVLCPPANVDPEMKLPTPDTGNNMPVIPPPGSPGGDSGERPK